MHYSSADIYPSGFTNVWFWKENDSIVLNTHGVLQVLLALQQVYERAPVEVQGVKPLKYFGLFTSGKQIHIF